MHQQSETYTTSDNLKNKYDMMISFAYTDKDAVYRIQQQLADHGYNIWCDHTHHRKGNFNKTISIMLKRVDFSSRNGNCRRSYRKFGVGYSLCIGFVQTR